MDLPFAHVLHLERIRELADGITFERGERYFREKRVTELLRREGSLWGTVSGSSSYRVRIWSKGDGLAYRCSCPVGKDGAFCKHCVALSLQWLQQTPRTEDLDELRTALDSCERNLLVAFLLETAEEDVLFTRRLLRRLRP
jgi:uncharacterized Zn finger protein